MHDGKAHRRDRGLATLLVACVLLVAFWEIMSNRSRRPLKPFLVAADDFVNFAPVTTSFHLRPLEVYQTPTEPNILAYEVRSAPAANDPRLSSTASVARAASLDKSQPLMVRIVHGYNMPDCMRIRGYDVTPIADRPWAPGAAPATSEGRRPDGGAAVPSACRVQVWRLTSDIGDRSVWASSMVRAGDGIGTDFDTRDQPFPRVGTPDDPNWAPRGFTLAGLRHPIRNLRLFLRSRWNSSRCDPATFLKLRQPVWASDELLTLVTASYSIGVAPADEAEVIEQVLWVHAFFLEELRRWGRARSEAAPAPEKP